MCVAGNLADPGYSRRYMYVVLYNVLYFGSQMYSTMYCTLHACCTRLPKERAVQRSSAEFAGSSRDRRQRLLNPNETPARIATTLRRYTFERSPHNAMRSNTTLYYVFDSERCVDYVETNRTDSSVESSRNTAATAYTRRVLYFAAPRDGRC